MYPQIGQTAPDFALPDETGKVHQLSDYRGQKVVLYFYPMDETPFCTREACNLRDNFNVLTEANIKLLGISYDSEVSHRKFKETHSLPFSLLSDADKRVARLYGANGGLFQAWLPRRVSFLIDEKGKLFKIIENVKVNSHAEQILAAFRS